MGLPRINTVWTYEDIYNACVAWKRKDLWEKYLALKPHLEPFVSDGPSCFPRFVDGHDLYDPAAKHDFNYYMGGTEKERFKADCELAIDVVFMSGGSPDLAMTMLIGVRAGGIKDIPTPWRWGFGLIKEDICLA